MVKLRTRQNSSHEGLDLWMYRLGSRSPFSPKTLAFEQSKQQSTTYPTLPSKEVIATNQKIKHPLYE
uniref:Putative ovule protein n=1 Tax=Solanum chacoense TaxID=4108 RepID=A0A0V0GNI4_SOLCH